MTDRGKLNESELAEIIGHKGARDVCEQDESCARVYGDIEKRTGKLRSIRDKVRSRLPENFDEVDDGS